MCSYFILRYEYIGWLAYFNHVFIFYSQICSSSYDVEAKYRAMMGMGTLVSDRVRPHSDKTEMMCLSNNHMWEEAHQLAFVERMVGSSNVIKFLVSMGTVP